MCVLFMGLYIENVFNFNYNIISTPKKRQEAYTVYILFLLNYISLSPGYRYIKVKAGQAIAKSLFYLLMFLWCSRSKRFCVTSELLFVFGVYVFKSTELLIRNISFYFIIHKHTHLFHHTIYHTEKGCVFCKEEG